MTRPILFSLAWRALLTLELWLLPLRMYGLFSMLSFSLNSYSSLLKTS